MKGKETIKKITNVLFSEKINNPSGINQVAHPVISGGWHTRIFIGPGIGILYQIGTFP